MSFEAAGPKWVDGFVGPSEPIVGDGEWRKVDAPSDADLPLGGLVVGNVRQSHKAQAWVIEKAAEAAEKADGSNNRTRGG